MFSYPSILGTGFSTTAFVEALAAGVRDEPFPLDSILYATREKYPTLKRARRQVPALYSDAEEDKWNPRRWLGDNNAGLLLSIAQDIPVDHERPLDIDHIYASALGYRMHDAKYVRAHHAERWRINTIGNMWLLDAGTNRALHHDKPRIKFDKLKHWLEARPNRVWPKAQWSITDSDAAGFIEVDERIDHDIDGAMRVFKDLVKSRADRLLDAPFEMLPEAKRFALDSKLEPPDDWQPTDALSHELAKQLGLAKVIDELAKPLARQHKTVDAAAVGARIPVLDLPRQSGWPKGWQTEFAYVDFHGERWEEPNIKRLYRRIFTWLWDNRREDLIGWNKAHGGPIAGPGHRGRWVRLDDEHYLQMGWWYQYLVGAVQEALDALSLAEGVYVVYANADR